MIVNGLIKSGLYALVSVGLALAFGIMRLVNFAHGEFVMLGAYTAYWLFAGYRIDPFLSLFIAGGWVFLLGVFVYRFAIRRVLSAPQLNQMLLTFGLSVFLQNLALTIWGGDARSMTIGYGAITLSIGFISVGLVRLIAFILSVFLIAALYLLLAHSRLGKSMRAASQSNEGAYLVGVNVDKTYAFAFGLAVALGAAAGAIITPVMYASPFVGFDFTLRAFSIIILAGLGNIYGVLWASLVLGMSESFMGTYLPQGSGWSDAVFFLLILLVLVIKPTGFGGTQIRHAALQSHPRQPEVRLKPSLTNSFLSLLALAVVVLPFWADPYTLHLAILLIMYAILAVSWDILARTGQVSVGHAGFFGIGAYTAALLFINAGMTPLFAILLSGAAASMAALGLGAATLRMRGVYFSIATLAFSEALRTFALRARNITGGAMGISVPPLFGGAREPAYYLILLVGVSTLLVSIFLQRSRFYFAFNAIRTNDETAQVIGINIVKHKILAFVLSSFFTGLVGGFYTHYTTYIIPYETFSLGISVASLVMPILGGLYSTTGPVIGAAVLKVLEEYLRASIGYGYMIVYGLMLTLIVLFLPGGLLGFWHNRLLPLVFRSRAPAQKLFIPATRSPELVSDNLRTRKEAG